MGLGKTLMTIATLFALHRRQKDKVSLYWTMSSAVPCLLGTHSNVLHRARAAFHCCVSFVARIELGQGV